MSELLQDLIVGGVALGAAATVLRRAWSAFAVKAGAPRCSSCTGCAATPPAAGAADGGQPRVHRLELIR